MESIGGRNGTQGVGYWWGMWGLVMRGFFYMGEVGGWVVDGMEIFYIFFCLHNFENSKSSFKFYGKIAGLKQN